MSLRAVGTRFSTRSENATSTMGPCVTTWEVVGHVLAGRFRGDEEGRLAEQVRVVSVEYEWWDSPKAAQ